MGMSFTDRNAIILGTAFTCSGDHPLQAKMAEKEELLLICKQMQLVLLLGADSSCTLQAG